MRLGDAEVPRIGLGTNRLSHTSEHVSFVREAVAAGIGHIDTAHLYAGGDNETTIGAALTPTPESLAVATKGGYYPEQPPRVGLSSTSQSSAYRQPPFTVSTRIGHFAPIMCP